MKHNGVLHGISHFASMFIAGIIVGQIVRALIGQNTEGYILSMIAGGFIGWNWSKLTGFGRKEK